MNQSGVLLLAFLVGIVAGLRSLTSPAVVAWAAHRNWLNLERPSLSFMGSTAAGVVFILLALIELIADQLPSTPSRPKAPGLIARIVLGGLSGACVAAAGYNRSCSARSWAALAVLPERLLVMKFARV